MSDVEYKIYLTDTQIEQLHFAALEFDTCTNDIVLWALHQWFWNFRWPFDLKKQDESLLQGPEQEDQEIPF